MQRSRVSRCDAGFEVAKGGIGLAVGLLGAVLGVVFIAMLIGGGIYHTECISDNGTRSVGWDAQGDIPYLWSPNDPRCQTHTLTRVVLGKVGVMSDVAR